ncbi:hypothetical protein JIN85_13550 [Luteolibacter pohnpeiensis]|uniref:Uncharacterized protein n=1 Tax=Luteolibacter pohnpeiensis TaxID=454153 RepID=A0A934VRP8_9BACT|nr:hypothetical protein [Luteolibacter pohnpeiensis]MBK1883446.1 hypothetical protein [Luteolibacter pohnpeiensis]
MNPALSAPKHGCAAWFLGCILYLFLALNVIGDEGIIGLLSQSIIGALFSIILVGVAWIVGLILRIPSVARLWYSNALPSISVILLALGVLYYGRDLGFITTYISTDANLPLQDLHPAAAFGSVFAAVFGTLHFSSGIRSQSDKNKIG